MGDRKRGRRIKEQWRKRGRKIESRVLEEKQIGGVGSCWWHFTAMNRVSTEVCFCYVCVKSIFWVLVSVSKNTRQRFANLRVGCRRIKKKKQKNRNGSQDPFHAFEKKKKKRALPCDFYLNFSPALPTSLSLSLLLLLLLLFAPSLLPPPHSLLQPAAGNRREEQASERRGVLFLPVSFFFSEAWIKVAFRAAIVRVIRKSYLQRVRVAREETARGMGDEACVCVCV